MDALGGLAGYLLRPLPGLLDQAFEPMDRFRPALVAGLLARQVSGLTGVAASSDNSAPTD